MIPEVVKINTLISYVQPPKELKTGGGPAKNGRVGQEGLSG